MSLSIGIAVDRYRGQLEQTFDPAAQPILQIAADQLVAKQ
jgi:hypothetical protein